MEERLLQGVSINNSSLEAGETHETVIVNQCWAGENEADEN